MWAWWTVVLGLLGIGLAVVGVIVAWTHAMWVPRGHRVVVHDQCRGRTSTMEAGFGMRPFASTVQQFQFLALFPNADRRELPTRIPSWPRPFVFKREKPDGSGIESISLVPELILRGAAREVEPEVPGETMALVIKQRLRMFVAKEIEDFGAFTKYEGVCGDPVNGYNITSIQCVDYTGTPMSPPRVADRDGQLTHRMRSPRSRPHVEDLVNDDSRVYHID